MKQLLLLPLLVISLTAAGQNKKLDSQRAEVPAEALLQPFSWVSPNRDTIYLLKTEIGHLVQKMWNEDKTTEKKPVIIMTDALPKRKPAENSRPK